MEFASNDDMFTNLSSDIASSDSPPLSLHSFNPVVATPARRARRRHLAYTRVRSPLDRRALPPDLRGAERFDRWLSMYVVTARTNSPERVSPFWRA